MFLLNVAKSIYTEEYLLHLLIKIEIIFTLSGLNLNLQTLNYATSPEDS